MAEAIRRPRMRVQKCPAAGDMAGTRAETPLNAGVRDGAVAARARIVGPGAGSGTADDGGDDARAAALRASAAIDPAAAAAAAADGFAGAGRTGGGLVAWLEVGLRGTRAGAVCGAGGLAGGHGECGRKADPSRGNGRAAAPIGGLPKRVTGLDNPQRNATLPKDAGAEFACRNILARKRLRASAAA